MVDMRISKKQVRDVPQTIRAKTEFLQARYFPVMVLSVEEYLAEAIP